MLLLPHKFRPMRCSLSGRTGCSAVLVLTVPNGLRPAALPRAQQAAEINITAANRSTAACGRSTSRWPRWPGSWPWALAATLAAATVPLRREFWSQSRQVMLTPPR
jgi:hypothetical protein